MTLLIYLMKSSMQCLLISNDMRRAAVTAIALMCSLAVLHAASPERKPEAAKEAHEVHDFDRGIALSTSTFIPKGTFGAGLTMSYNTIGLGQAADDAGYSLLSLLTGIKGDMYSFGIAPNVSYFLIDNLAVGLRFDYDRSSLDLANVGLSLGDMLSMQISDYHYLSHSYTTSATCRYYIPFGESKRFAMFAEGRLTGGYGQSVMYRLDQGDKFGTYQTNIKASLDIVPGLSAFVTNNVALEVSIGVLGLNYNRVKQVTNQVETSIMRKSGANFRLNLFSIGMGISVYLPTKLYIIKDKKRSES